MAKIVLCYNRGLVGMCLHLYLGCFLSYCGFIFYGCECCVFNKSHGHWLLSNALHTIITMTLKVKE
jgi:hypothetical protein